MHALLTRRRRWRRTVAFAAAAAFTAAAIATVPPGPASAQAGCVAVEHQASTWSTGPDTGGFVFNITLTNVCGEPIQGWTLQLRLAPQHTLDQGWSAQWSSAGDLVTATHLSWNREIDPDESTTIGFIGRFVGTFQDPLSCSINGHPCDGEEPEPNLPPQVTLTSPADGFGTPITCPVPMAADATDPDGAVDRVEFFVNDQLAGTDDTAPYELEVGGPGGPLVLGDNVAFARAFDDGDPALSTDSEPVTFAMLVPPPGPPAPGDCDSPIPPLPPQVFLTSPTQGQTFPSPCAIPLAANAVDIDGEVVRVDFVVNNVLVGSDVDAPYRIEIPGGHPALGGFGEHVAYARAVDDEGPGQVGVSQLVEFSQLVPPPALMIIACTNPVQLAEGASQVVNLRNLCADDPLVEMTVTGDPGISVSPTSFTFSDSGQDVTISAAAGSAGAAATVRAEADSCLPATIQVTVAGGGGG